MKHMSFTSLIPYHETKRAIGHPCNPGGNKSKFFSRYDDGGRTTPFTRDLQSEETDDPQQVISSVVSQPTLQVSPFFKYHQYPLNETHASHLLRNMIKPEYRPHSKITCTRQGSSDIMTHVFIYRRQRYPVVRTMWGH